MDNKETIRTFDSQTKYGDGGLLDKVFKKTPDDGKWARDPKKDSELENYLEYAPGLGNVLSVNDALTSYQNAIKNPSWNNIKDAGLETLGLIPFGSVFKNAATGLGRNFVRKATHMGHFVDVGINTLSDSDTDLGVQKKEQSGFLDYYKSIPSYKNDTSSYNLRRAYELAPKKELEAFAKSNAHLKSVYMNPKTGVYEFMKSKDHPTLKYELDWYNSDDPEAIKFRNDYSLDTTGNYYKYVPKKEQGGYIRTSKSGRKFTYPSIEQRKQEIINKITMKTTNKPDD